jgi:hypothetical protein
LLRARCLRRAVLGRELWAAALALYGFAPEAFVAAMAETDGMLETNGGGGL